MYYYEHNTYVQLLQSAIIIIIVSIKLKYLCLLLLFNSKLYVDWLFNFFRRIENDYAIKNVLTALAIKA